MDVMTKTVSRRWLLLGLAAGAGVFGAVSAPALRLRQLGRNKFFPLSWWAPPALALDTAAMNIWLRQVGSTFTLVSEAGFAAMRLASVQPFGSGGRRPADLARGEAFAAVFETTSGAIPAGNRIYTLYPAEGNALDVFFGPSNAASGKRIVAVFN